MIGRAMPLRRVTPLLAAALLAGCSMAHYQARQNEVHAAIRERFIGTASDAFFLAYGAPASSFALNSGGKIHRWRGGENTTVLPAQQESGDTLLGVVTSQQRKTTSGSGRSTTITDTHSKSWVLGGPETVTYGEVTIRQFCEMQLTVDTAGLIVNIDAFLDTKGNGFHPSRCAEVFRVARK
ncbi:MAG: hypothetical protein RLY71_1011 [Pseudomonadota bacterium]